MFMTHEVTVLIINIIHLEMFSPRNFQHTLWETITVMIDCIKTL